jgi:hypothetical protein
MASPVKTKLALLVLGLAGGLVGGYFARPWVDRAVGISNEIEGVVVEERREDERLVLTLRAGEETVLASFRERADDVEQLVAPGDFLTVRLGARGVFADEVPIVRLRRAADVAAEESSRRSRRRRRGEARGDEGAPRAETESDETSETGSNVGAPHETGGDAEHGTTEGGALPAPGSPTAPSRGGAPSHGPAGGAVPLAAHPVPAATVARAGDG